MNDQNEIEMNIVVRFESREDGGLRAYCDQLPGFSLSHKRPQRVYDQVAPALRHLLKLQYNGNVKLTEIAPSDEVVELYDHKISKEPSSAKQFTVTSVAA